MRHDARLVLEKAAWGGDAALRRELRNASAAEVGARLVKDAVGAERKSAPGFLDLPFFPRPMSADDSVKLDKIEKRAIVRVFKERVRALSAWWIGEMRTTRAPLVENMVLFFHNHFVSTYQGVKSPRLLARQNDLFRTQATGSFRTLLSAVLEDAAMLRFLDGAGNAKGAPNENLARELMELFTLGEGVYTERDVKQVARALTGYVIEPLTGTAVFRRRRHDDGTKEILQKRGSFAKDDVVAILLDHPSTARTLSAKLARHFVADDPDSALVDELARVLRANDYAMAPWLEALLTSPDLVRAQGARTKSPVDLVVGTARALALPDVDDQVLAVILKDLGQELFGAPNVRGWPGGRTWLDTSSLALRKEALSRAGSAAPKSAAPDDVFLATAPLGAAKTVDERLLDPAYQVV